MSSKIKIVIVDDHPVVIQGFKQVLTEAENISIVAEFQKGEGVISFLESHFIDIVLMDVTLPDISGVILCKMIVDKIPHIKVLMVSNHSERSIISESISNGAKGYLLKNATMNEFLNAILEVINGKQVFSKEVQTILEKPLILSNESKPRLTKREKEIVKLLMSGKTNNIIAEELFLSPFTVETHRKNIMQKFEAKNLMELINQIKLHENLI